MDTDQLIRSLAADNDQRERPVGSVLARNRAANHRTGLHCDVLHRFGIPQGYRNRIA